jgi:ABC-2 type transport system ATP-binding protein
MLGGLEAIDSAIPSHATIQPVVSVENIRVTFAKLQAVRDVTFQLHPGNLLGLIGPNGAGKTTLLRALCGLQPITAGTVRILGDPLTPQRSDLLTHIGFTPDVPSLYEDLTVRQFLRFIGKGYDLPRSTTDERIDFWLDKVWLREKAETKIKTLSRGMKQRCGIARTLLPNPSVILLDEPAAGLDPAGRVQFRQLLCDLRDQGKALIVSSHILSDMADYCTHIAIMTAGQIVKFGTVSEVTNMHGGDRCRYTILLAHPVPRLENQLTDIPGATNIVVDRETVLLEYANDRAQAAALLAELVARKIPIASFTANAVDLEEAYLRVGIRQVD